MFKLLYCLVIALLTVAGAQLLQREFPSNVSWQALIADPVWFGWACVLLSAPVIFIVYAALHLWQRRRQLRAIEDGQHRSRTAHRTLFE
jgi:phage baseplate assembly protein W